MGLGEEVIDKSVGDTCEGTIEYDGAADDKYFSAEAEYPALCFELKGGCGDGIGKACYWHEGTCACVFCELFVPAERGKEC